MTQRHKKTLDDPRAHLAPRLSANASRKGYRIQNAAGGEAEVLLYDAIAWYAVAADQFARDLQKITASTIRLRINSPGGDVFDGIAMYNALVSHPAKVITQVDGLAASAASVVALAGDEIRMSDGAFVMIHNAWAGTMGNARDLRKTADLLDSIDSTLAGLYARRMGITADEAKALLDAETWFSAEDAVAQGFADAVDQRPAVEAAFDLSGFQHTPAALRVAASGRREMPAKPDTIRDFESLLRDVGGFSNAEAKRIASGGFKALTEPRDERTTDADLSPLSDLAQHIRSLSSR